MQYIIEHKIEVGKDLVKSLKAKFNLDDIEDVKILRESIDARDKEKVLYNYLLSLKTKGKIPSKYLKTEKKIEKLKYIKWPYEDRPVIVGLGPAGLFAGLYLARCNACPIILERGEEVSKRKVKVDNFFKNKVLDLNSNIVFGEGGAGTFSDGKLQTNAHSPYIRFVLEEFVKHGADPSILVSNYPHVGTDILAKVIPNIRQEIVKLGGEVYFDALFYDYDELKDGLLVKSTKGDFYTKHLILALGHSAKDTFKLLYNKKIVLEPKPFAIGVRIEHLQKDINDSQYGKYAKYLPPANYKLVCHLKERSVFTFCMCPGGYVVASQNEYETIVTNGMSNFKRDGQNANSALLVEIKPEDYFNGNPLDGFSFLESIEKKAYNISGDYKAPANLVGSFLKDEIATKIKTVKPTYPHGIYFSDFKDIFPEYVIKALKEAIIQFDLKLQGFADEDAIITGVETRSSSPVRIKRDNYQASNRYIYPIGEGSGYAGGITTSALDGIKCIISILGGKL